MQPCTKYEVQALCHVQSTLKYKIALEIDQPSKPGAATNPLFCSLKSGKAKNRGFIGSPVSMKGSEENLLEPSEGVLGLFRELGAVSNENGVLGYCKPPFSHKNSVKLLTHSCSDFVSLNLGSTELDSSWGNTSLDPPGKPLCTFWDTSGGLFLGDPDRQQHMVASLLVPLNPTKKGTLKKDTPKLFLGPPSLLDVWDSSLQNPSWLASWRCNMGNGSPGGNLVKQLPSFPIVEVDKWPLQEDGSLPKQSAALQGEIVGIPALASQSNPDEAMPFRWIKRNLTGPRR